MFKHFDRIFSVVFVSILVLGAWAAYQHHECSSSCTGQGMVCGEVEPVSGNFVYIDPNRAGILMNRGYYGR